MLGGVPVHVVDNGVDVARFSPGPAEGARLDALAGLPPAHEGTLRVGLVATYARWKRSWTAPPRARLGEAGVAAVLITQPVVPERAGERG